MIRTLDDRFLKDVWELKIGDVFQTNRNGTLPWSRWFIVTHKPRYAWFTIPRPRYRWAVDAVPIDPFFGIYLFRLLRQGDRSSVKRLARILGKT